MHGALPDKLRAVTSRTRIRRRVGFFAMADPRRVARVQKQIEREIGDLLLNDKVLLQAVQPELRSTSEEAYAAFGDDEVGGAISGFACVAAVELSRDLQVAKVYVSVMSDEAGQMVAMQNLLGLQGYVRGRLARRLSLRLVPEVRFVRDKGLEQGTHVLGMLERLRAERDGTSTMEPLLAPIDVGEAEDFGAEAKFDEEGWIIDDEDVEDENDVLTREDGDDDSKWGDDDDPAAGLSDEFWKDDPEMLGASDARR